METYPLVFPIRINKIFIKFSFYSVKILFDLKYHGKKCKVDLI